MLYEGSFWIQVENNCFDKTSMGFLSFSADFKPQKKLQVLFRQEFKNISEDQIITRLLLERYSDNQIAIYISTRKQDTTIKLFTKLSQIFSGSITILNVRGPIALNTILHDNQHAHSEVNNVFNAIDQFEQIQPGFIRQKLVELTKIGEAVES